MKKTDFITSFAATYAAALPVALILSRSGADIVAGVICLLFLIQSYLARDWSWLKTTWVKVTLILWLYLMLTGIIADNTAFIRALSFIRYPLLAMALAFWLLKDEPTRRNILCSLTFATCFLIFDSLLQYATGQDLFGIPTTQSEGAMRLTGPFAGPTVGIFLTWTAFPVLWAVTLKKPIAGAALIALFLVTVLLTGERSAFLLSLMGVGISGLLFPIRARFKLMAAAACAFVLITALIAFPAVFERQVKTVGVVATQFKDTPYGQLWRTGINTFQANPITGIGLKQFRNRCQEYAPPEADIDILCANLHPHNIYIEWFAESGLIGGILFLILIGCWIREVRKSFPQARLDPAFYGLCIAMLLRLFPLIPSQSLFASWTAIPFFMLLGWLLAFRRTRQASEI